jgi:hypothetical protein
VLGFHENDVAVPCTVSKVDVPIQIFDSAGVIETVGIGCTTIVLVWLALLHPRLPPYTENTELMLGFATATPPLLYVVKLGVAEFHV